MKETKTDKLMSRKQMDNLLEKLKKQLGKGHLILLVKSRMTKKSFYTSTRQSYDMGAHTAIGILEYTKLKLQQDIEHNQQIERLPFFKR